MSNKQGLWQHEAARVISRLLKANGINKTEIGGRSRIGQRSVITSGYELSHWKNSKEIDIRYRVSRFDDITDGEAKLDEIKGIVEASGYDVECRKIGNRLAVTYKTPFDQREEEYEATNG